MPGRVGGRSERPRGQVLVLFAASITCVLAFAGIAFDIGRFYSERRFLQNAADAAALAAVQKLIADGTDLDARAAAMSSLARNLARPPTGTPANPVPPSGSEVYEPGHNGDADYLIDGILINQGTVRVAINSGVTYTFGRVVGLDQNVVRARAKASSVMDLLPVAVRRYVGAPGPNAGAAYPCTAGSGNFQDFLSTSDTSCLGSETDASLRTSPSPGLPFDALNPNNDPANHGPVVELLGVGAQPANGADFRGFVCLDVRDFESTTSRQYYNGADATMSDSALALQQAEWIMKGYPGPDFPVSTVPADYGSQIATLSGNNTGIAIDAFNTRFRPGDEAMMVVYSGTVYAIPDFVVRPPAPVEIGTTQTLPVAGTFTVARNSAFSGQVDLNVLPDIGNPLDPITTGRITSSPPITFDPDPVTPTLGGGTTVTMRNVQTTAAIPGIYTLWLHGHSPSPYLRDHYEVFELNVGNVRRTYNVTSSSPSATAVTPGATVFWDIAWFSNSSGPASFGGGNVTISLDNPLPAGLGSVSWNGSTTFPLGSSGNTNVQRRLTVNTGTTAPGDYPLVLRTTGFNSAGQPVTKLLLLNLRISVGTPSTTYVDILGFAVFRISGFTTNTMYGYAITPMKTDPHDPALRRGQVARLKPWN